MNRILLELENYMIKSMQQVLPDLSMSSLENEGSIYYMNGNKGTAFDWYVNDRLPGFFIFYNDEENLGAVKALLHNDGELLVYVFGDNGHGEPDHFEYTIDADKQEILNLAVILNKNADDKRIWDEDIRKIESDELPDEQLVEEFISLKEAHVSMRERRSLMGKTVIVSKKVREGGWKIGYGLRDEPTREGDSGWFFSVGDEDEEYINNPENLELWVVGSTLMYDSALSEFISAPYGTAIVRVSSDKFELDEPGKEIYFEKNINS